MSSTQSTASISTPTARELAEKIGTDALEGGLTALANGGSTTAAAHAVLDVAAQAAALAVAPQLDALHTRVAAMETKAGDYVIAHPLIGEIVSLLKRFFPHEVSAMTAMIDAGPAATKSGAPHA